MQRQRSRRPFAQQIPWQVSVGAAFAITVLCCAKRRLDRKKRQRRPPRQSTATQVQQNAADASSTQQQDGKGSAAQCHLPPLKVLLVDEALNCDVQQLWNIICKPDPHFQRTIHRLSGNRNIAYGEWHKEGDSLVRQETYINPLKKNSLGPSEAECVDQQKCVHRSSAGFVLERKVHTPSVPFGGSFYNIVQWCAWVEPGSHKLRLQVSCDVTFTKRFVPVKGLIYNSSIEGMERFYKMWLEQVYHHLKLLNSPSQSAATVRNQHQQHTAAKKKLAPLRLNMDQLLPWVTVLVLLAWLLLQRLQQADGLGGWQHGAFTSLQGSSSVLPDLVPTAFHSR